MFTLFNKKKCLLFSHISGITNKIIHDRIHWIIVAFKVLNNFVDIWTFGWEKVHRKEMGSKV